MMKITPNFRYRAMLAELDALPTAELRQPHNIRTFEGEVVAVALAEVRALIANRVMASERDGQGGG